MGREPLDLLSERDSIYRLLAQTTPENISKNFEEFGINPASRYPNLNKESVSKNRVKHLFDNKDGPIDQYNGPEPMDTSKDLSNIEGGGKGFGCVVENQQVMVHVELVPINIPNLCFNDILFRM